MAMLVWTSSAIFLKSVVTSSSKVLTSDIEEIQGELNLYQIEDTHHILKFQPFNVFTTYSFDIDDISDVDLDKRTIHCKMKEFSVRIRVQLPDAIRKFQECIDWCRKLCLLTLRMRSIARDYYFAGIYSVMDSQSDSFEFHSSFPLLTTPQSFEIVEISTDDKNVDENARNKILSTKCIFCQTEKRNAPSVDYFIHPYVPSNSSGESIAMCDHCLMEWQRYRQAASQRNELILEGEENEEICAVCSDTPTEIVMCSACLRSFCNSCLVQVLLLFHYLFLTPASSY